MRRLALVLACCLALPPATGGAAGGTEARLDRLFDELQALDKRREDRAGAIQARIWGIWYDHPDRRVRELMDDGLRALAQDRLADADDVFSRIVERAPGYAEAWNRRATTRYMMEHYERALDDIERVLELEPRHFGALAGRGLCLRELGRPRQALAALRRALEINPHLDNVYLEILRIRAETGLPAKTGPGSDDGAPPR